MTVVTPVQTAVIAGPTPQNISADARAVIAELSQEYLERSEALTVVMGCILAKQHVFMLGEPGTGKTAMAEAMCLRFTGGKFWSVLMDRQLGKEDLFGPIDIAQYEHTSKTGKGIWERDIEDTLLDCHIALIDEVGKAGPGSLNPMLRVANERKFRNGKNQITTPLITMIGASNEYLESELAAMWDRFLARLNIKALQETGNVVKLLGQVVSPLYAATETTIDMDDLLYAVDHAVPAVRIPPGITDSVAALRADLRSEQITPSDRRMKQCMRLLQAMAYLDGRDFVDDDDIAVLQHCLWDVEAEIPMVTKKVLALTSPLSRKAVELTTSLEEIENGLAERRGQGRDKLAAYGGDAQFKITEVRRELNAAIEQANREGRSTHRLDPISGKLRSVKKMVLVECLNLPEARAEAAVAKDA